MNLIAIHTGHNAGVAVFKEGHLVSMVTEDKWTNVKNQAGFPFQSLRDATIFFNDPSDIEKVIVCGEYHLADVLDVAVRRTQDAGIGLLRWFRDMGELHSPLPRSFFRSVRKQIYGRISSRIRPQMVEEITRTLKVPPGLVEFRDHHTLHCLSPVVFYGIREPVLCFSLDGDGGLDCGKIVAVYGDKYQVLVESPYDYSLGFFFSDLTQFLGMRPLEHEYKVMGLAAYVSRDRCQDWIDRFHREVAYVDVEQCQIVSRYDLLLSKYYFRKHCVGVRFDLLAAAAQYFIEDLVTEWVTAAVKRWKIPNVAFAGGVFQNVKLNQRIVNLPCVHRAWFQPGAGDESLPIGAGFGGSGNGLTYHGLDYTQAEIESILNQCRIPYVVVNDIDHRIAMMLAEGRIVARFSGRSECGPRALGNRSILARPDSIHLYHQLNDQIKCRDFWMPFAPSILVDAAHKYIKDWKKTWHSSSESLANMCVTVDATELGYKDFIAACHAHDRTFRPQIVRQQDNPGYYRLIALFEGLTGIGGVLNTSLNIHGKPMVATIEQAILTWENSRLQHMAIGNCLLSKDHN